MMLLFVADAVVAAALLLEDVATDVSASVLLGEGEGVALLLAGRQTLAGFKGIVAGGGFAYGDVLGAGRGWADAGGAL